MTFVMNYVLAAQQGDPTRQFEIGWFLVGAQPL